MLLVTTTVSFTVTGILTITMSEGTLQLGALNSTIKNSVRTATSLLLTFRLLLYAPRLGYPRI